MNNFPLARGCGGAAHANANTISNRDNFVTTFLGRVALGAQRSVVIKLSRERSVGRSVRRSVGRLVGLSSALWINGRSDPDAVSHHRSDGSREKAGSGVWGSVHGKGYFWGGDFGRATVTNGEFTA